MPRVKTTAYKRPPSERIKQRLATKREMARTKSSMMKEKAAKAQAEEISSDDEMLEVVGRGRAKKTEASSSSAKTKGKGPGSTSGKTHYLPEMHFVSDTRYGFYVNSIAERPITPAFRVDLNSFKAKGLDFFYLFERCDWLPLFDIHEKVYPDLVKIFYSNMNWLDVEGALVSHVKGRRILISPETIETVLKVPNKGKKLFCLTKWVEHQEELVISYYEAVVSICDNIHELKKNKPTHAALGHTWAQLHRIISHYIFPRNGSFEKVSFMDTLLLYCLIYNWPMNFGYMMTKAMYEIAVTAKDTSLPYAMFLTCFFKHFKVNLDHEASEPVNRVLLGRRAPPEKANPSGKGKAKKTADDDSDDVFPPSGNTEYYFPKAFKDQPTFTLKKVMNELVTELISFTEIQRFMFSSLSRKHNTFARNMQEASDKWKMIESHLCQVPSDDEQVPDEDDDVSSDP